MVFRAGDHVRHLPSGEAWVLACDEERGEVVCCGWPETSAKAADCELLTSTSDEGRRELLLRVAVSCRDQSRGHRALAALMREPNPPCAVCVRVKQISVGTPPATRRTPNTALCGDHYAIALAEANAAERKATADVRELLDAEHVEPTL